MTVTEVPASAANTEATEDEETEDFLKKNLFFSKRATTKCRVMGEKMDNRWEKQEETSLRHHLAMLKCSRNGSRTCGGYGDSSWWSCGEGEG